MADSIRSKSWCVNFHNCLHRIQGDAEVMSVREWVEQEVPDEWYVERRIQWMVYQLENAGGLDHVQLFVHFEHAVPRKRVQVRLGALTADCRTMAAKGKTRFTSQRDYCHKVDSHVEGTPQVEWGVMPVQGKRARLDDLHDAMVEGKLSIMEMQDQHFGAWVRGGSVVQDYQLRVLAAKARARFVAEPMVELQWQIDLEKDLLSPVKRRRIFWVWSKTSKTGKSTFMQKLIRESGATAGIWDLSNFLYVYQASLSGIICFNLPRYEEMDKKKLSILESLSDGGDITCGKYKGMMVPVHAHILVFANYGPPRGSLPGRIVERRLREVAIEDGRALVRSNAAMEAELMARLRPVVEEVEVVDLTEAVVDLELPASWSDSDTVVWTGSGPARAEGFNPNS